VGARTGAALPEAASAGDHEALRALLERGADPSPAPAPSPSGYSIPMVSTLPLYRTARSGSNVCVQLDRVDSSTRVAPSVEMLDVLLALGADPQGPCVARACSSTRSPSNEPLLVFVSAQILG
jgi:hypothetical protein